MRVLSGIQPTGRFHWGNYFGAIRQYIDLQHEDAAYYFIANLHALTAVRDPELLRQLTLDAAIDLLALGLNPEKAILFVQSDVPEVSQLVLAADDRHADGPAGTLPRLQGQNCQGPAADAGLFTYPVLMAADILAYDSDTVPVGADQVQHIEVCRDIAASFNHHFGQTFVMPKAKVLEHRPRCPGSTAKKCRRATTTRWSCSKIPRRSGKKSCASSPTRARWSSRRSRRPIICFNSSRWSPNRSRARRNGRALSPRRFRLRRSEKSPGRRRREVFCRTASTAG